MSDSRFKVLSSLIQFQTICAWDNLNLYLLVFMSTTCFHVALVFFIYDATWFGSVFFAIEVAKSEIFCCYICFPVTLRHLGRLMKLEAHEKKPNNHFIFAMNTFSSLLPNRQLIDLWSQRYWKKQKKTGNKNLRMMIIERKGSHNASATKEYDEKCWESSIRFRSFTL